MWNTYLKQTSQPQKTKHLEIKFKKKKGRFGKKRQKELKAVHQNKVLVSVYHRFPSFWQSGQKCEWIKMWQPGMQQEKTIKIRIEHVLVCLS